MSGIVDLIFVWIVLILVGFGIHIVTDFFKKD